VVVNGISESPRFKPLKLWETNFGNNFLAIDGSKLNAQPGAELIRIQNFLGISPTIDQDSFVFNDERQFYCLKSAGMGCSGSGKGRSKGHNFENYLHDKLRDLFLPFDQNLAKLLNTTIDWNY